MGRRERHDRGRARTLLQERVNLSRDGGTVRDAISALHELAWAETRQGEISAARDRLQEALELGGSIGGFAAEVIRYA